MYSCFIFVLDPEGESAVFYVSISVSWSLRCLLLTLMFCSSSKIVVRFRPINEE